MVARQRFAERVNVLFGNDVASIYQKSKFEECILVTNEVSTEDVVFDYFEGPYLNRGLVKLIEEYGARYEWKNPGELLVFIQRH